MSPTVLTTRCSSGRVSLVVITALVPTPLQSSEGRLREQQSYGIYYDDDYDYLQHLKEPGTAVLEPVGGVAQTGGVVSPPVGAEVRL